MSIWRVLSNLTRESERDLKHRFTRAKLLLSGKESAREYLDDRNVTLSGKIFLVTTWRTGKGEEDFRHILQSKHHKVEGTIRINWKKYAQRALAQAIRMHSSQFSAGDIVAIVRGGGDINDVQFTPFNEPDAVKEIRLLKEKKNAVVITGVGHSSDYFAIEKEATFRRATPTDAAYWTCELLEEE